MELDGFNNVVLSTQSIFHNYVNYCMCLHLIHISACIAFVNVYPGQVSGQATEESTATNNSTCEAICRAQLACRSYQINTNPGQTLCWIQKEANPFADNNMYKQENVIEFVKTDCSSGEHR